MPAPMGEAAQGRRLGRAFYLLIASDGLMLLAVMVGQVARPWWIAHQGGAGHLALYAGFLALVSFVALPLLSPLGDRVSKRVLLTVALGVALVESVLIALMAQAGLYRIDWILLLGLVQMLAMAVIGPVSFSIVAEMLPPAQLSTGLGYQRSAQALGRLAGPVAGGAVLAATDTATALWMNAALLVLSVLMAARVVVPPRTAPARPLRRWMHDLRAGLAAKWHIPTERGWTFVSFLVMVFFSPGIGMLVPLKVQSLGLSAGWLGACEAGLSVGMLAGSLGGSEWIARRVGRFRASFGAVLGEGLSLALMGLTHQPLVMVAALTVVGGCIATVQTVGHTQRMLAMPQDFRARMTAVNLMAMQVAGVIGPGLVGAGLAVMSVDWVYFGVGVGLFLVGLAYRRVPGYRRFLDLPHDEVVGVYAREHPALFATEAAEPGAGQPKPKPKLSA